MRKLATAAAVSLALATSGAFGLGLGDIEMRSALNQPMNAEIRLTAVKPGELDGMIVQLASADAFARAGLERSSVLTDLTFSVDQSGPAPVIRVASQRPIVEPFLNFLLEVDWPQGRMVREYTVLLDPPVFMTPSATERNTNTDQPALVQRGDEALVVPTPIERADDAALGFEVELFDEDGPINAPVEAGEIVSLETLDNPAVTGLGDTLSLGDGEIVSLTDLEAPNTAALEQRAQQAFDLDSIEVELVGADNEVGDDVVIDGPSGSATTASDAGGDGSTIVSLDDLQPAGQGSVGASAANREVTVNRGDTLFEIAQNNSVSGVSVQQMMLALLAANETAFINNNINLVRAGSNLRVPDAEEASRVTQTQALAAIGEQNQLWQEYRDQIRGNAATQLAQAPTTGSSTVEETPAIDTASLDEEATDGLSAEARAILDSARDEILNLDELKLVADSAPSSTAASATADETSDSDAQRLGELNRKLQLAREELSSSRLQSEDLSDQVGELQSTTDNLDALVALRQNEVAELESQLALAREASEAAAAAGEGAVDAAGDAVASAGDAAGSVVEGAESTAANVGDAVTGVTDSVAGAAGELAADASSVMSNAAEGVESAVESGADAVDEAGNKLAQVDLVGDESEAAEADAAVAPPAQETTWYQDFLGDPKRMMIAGIGGLGLLGVLGTLLFRRKRRDDDDSMLDFEDDVEFIDEEEAGDLHADMDGQHQDSDPSKDRFSATGAAAGVAAAGAAAVGGTMAAGAAFRDNKDDSSALSEKFDDLADSSLAMGSETQAVADATADDALDKDDTISEVDVYLAYGLHGQAEELLTKAMDRKPNQPEYAQKLLQTYHAQGNSEGFHQTAEGFHARFGGESNPEWAGIAAMGAELRPEDPLYASAANAVQAIGTGDSGGSKFDSDDFLPAQDSGEGSVSRDFASSEPAVDLQSGHESDLMDQSLDPAFAFDESDLEATGDFSQITGELAAENDGSIDFPDFDDAADASKGVGAGVAAGAAAATAAIAANGHDLTGDLDVSLSDMGDDLGDALTMDELDGVMGSADDLTLDLDQLSGDLELDTDELLNSDLSDLDIPELTADNDLLSGDDQIAVGESDEMDTMLDLAKAYIDMGDKDSASSALGEIVKSGSPEQVNEAESLLRNIS